MNIRLIGPHDEAAYRSILERTSDDDRYDRFFHLVDALNPADVRRFIEPRPDMIGTIAFENGAALGAAHAALCGIHAFRRQLAARKSRLRRLGAQSRPRTRAGRRRDGALVA